ncbi:TIGR00299 family protein [archaeon SCG-AAA382B04]|nr:TIGR00299 family protein [archaeon SCG-AAA382B04]
MSEKVLYFDFSAGVAGDMLLGALSDLVESREIIKVAEELDLDANISIADSKDHGIRGKSVSIESNDKTERTLSDIKDMIKNSSLDPKIISNSTEVFQEIAKAEGEIHGKEPNEIHFHEVGAIDSIIDVVGTFSLLNKVNPSKIYASKINLGRGGTIKCAHGKLPNPAPATTKLLKGIPVHSTIEGHETVTPTGSALVKQVVNEFDKLPQMNLKKTGRGIGKKKLPVPDIVTVLLGET